MKRSRVGNSRREVLKGTRAGDEELEEVSGLRFRQRKWDAVQINWML